VSLEGLLGTINCGRSAMGKFGICVASACSYNQKSDCLCLFKIELERASTHRRNLDRTVCRLFSLSAVQRATEAMPLPMSLSRSISTSMPMPYAGIRDFDVLEKWLVGLITKPIDPRVQSLGCWETEGPSKKGLESSSFVLGDAFVGGTTSPFHSQSQQRRERSLMSNLTVRPEYAFREW
jgi:hypothetical protein